MKKIFHITLYCFLTVFYLAAQNSGAPQGFNYQAIARDFKGYELKNREILVKVRIKSGSATGVTEWSETHGLKTNEFGLFNIIIGTGSRIPEESARGNFGEIQWGSDPHFIEVLVDFKDTHGFITTGSFQFYSVPYALYANYAANGGNGGGNEKQNLSQTDTLLLLINADGSTQSSLKNDFDPKNEIQDLSLNNHILKITNNPEANDISLVPYLDNTDNQSLYNKDDSIGIVRGNKISLERFKDNTDSQNLILEEDSIRISGGNAVSITELKNPSSISFYAEKNTISTVNIATDNYLIFDEKKLNLGDAYSSVNGNLSILTDGLYSFYFTYDGVDRAQEVKIYINNGEHDLLPTVANQKLRWSFMLYLTSGDVVNMVINSGLSTQISKAAWSGYKVY